MKKNSEEYCQMYLVSLLKKLQLTGCDFLFFHTPNGGQRTKIAANQMKMQGALAGVYDIIIASHGKIIFVENKLTTNTLSHAQVTFKQKMSSYGFLCFEVYADSPKDMINAYLDIIRQQFDHITLPSDIISRFMVSLS